MILLSLFRTTAPLALAALLAAPAYAQVPMPQPRPTYLKMTVPVIAQMSAPVQAAPAIAPAPVAPPPTVEAPPLAPLAQAALADSGSVPDAAPTRAEPVQAVAKEPPPPVSLQPLPPATEISAPIKPAPLLAAAPPVSAAAKDTDALGKVNTYFNRIRTLVGNFTQVGPDGSRAGGKFFIAKPGRLRFYYQQPSTTDIIADGKSVVVRDRKLATQDVYPLSQTPLKFLLDPNLDLLRDSKVIDVREEPGLVSVVIEESTTFGGTARLLLVFSSQDSQNFELKQWTITDAQGLDTTIAVSELDTRTKPDDKLFKVDYTRYIR